MNNYDEIRKMKLDEMVKFIQDTNNRCNCVYEHKLDCFENTCEQGIKQWLLTEVESDN